MKDYQKHLESWPRGCSELPKPPVGRSLQSADSVPLKPVARNYLPPRNEPMSVAGQNAKYSVRVDCFRFASDSGHRRPITFHLRGASASSERPANRKPSRTLFILLLNAAVPTIGPKLFKEVLGQSFK